MARSGMPRIATAQKPASPEAQQQQHQSDRHTHIAEPQLAPRHVGSSQRKASGSDAGFD